MKNWTVDYSIEEKLEILEKEWLPIVIEKSSKKQEAEEKINFSQKHGFLPIIEPEMMETKTFEEYLSSRVVIERTTTGIPLSDIFFDPYFHKIF